MPLRTTVLQTSLPCRLCGRRVARLTRSHPLRRARCAAVQAGKAGSTWLEEPMHHHVLSPTVCSEQAQLFSLHLGETTLSLPVPASEAQNMRSSLDALLQTFAEKQKAERPKRWKMMEYRYKGGPDAGSIELFELFCNPNAHTSPFDAKILVTLKAGQGVAVTTEGSLSAVRGDIDAYLEQTS